MMGCTVTFEATQTIKVRDWQGELLGEIRKTAEGMWVFDPSLDLLSSDHMEEIAGKLRELNQ